MTVKCWELFQNYLVWEMLYNCGGLFFHLKFALLWPMASRRIAFWQFCLFIILSNTPNYPIKAVSLPLTCFFPLYFPSRGFFCLSLNTWITASKRQLNIFRYAKITSGDFFLIGCYDLRALQILSSGIWMKLQCMWSLAVGFNVLSFLSILSVTTKKNISGNFQGVQCT